MTSRRGGAVAVVLGLAVTAGAWFGIWPLAAPVFGRGPDYTGLHGLSLGIAIAGSLSAIMGLFLLFAGRGGPDDWDQR